MIRGDNLVVRVRADVKQFMDDMRAAQHATYDSVRAIKALNVTAGGDLNKLLSSTIRNTVAFATNAAKTVIGDALQAIAFEENNQMALAALAEYRMKQEAIAKLSTERVQVGTKVLTVEQQLAALEKRRMEAMQKGIAGPSLDQINWLNDIKRLQTDIQQAENGIIRAREKLADSTKQLTDTERQRLTLQIQEYQEKINDITTYQIPKAQEKLAKSGYSPFQATEDQVDWEAMAAQIMKGGDKVVGVFADQMQGLTKQNIEDIKKKADEESRATMEVLSTMAIKSPFSRKEIVEGYGTLVRMGGITFEQGKEMMQQIVDIQSVTGKGNRGIQAMTLAVGKVLATGRLNGDAVNQLVKTAGIPVWEILAQSTGKQVAELQKMMRANKLSAEIVVPALQNYMKDFAGKAAEEAGTFVGLINSISDLKDSVYVDFFQPIGESLKRPFADLVDMLTGGPFRQSIRDAGKFIANNIAGAIDFVYRAVEKFRVLGNDIGNPFTRIMIILADAAKEFNVDTSGIIKFVSVVENIFNWALINKDSLTAIGLAFRDFFAGLIMVTSLTSVLGKIQMFLTGFLASPIGLIAAAITAVYLAWKNNLGGIQDWTTQNGPIIVAFLKDAYKSIYDIVTLLPHVDFEKFITGMYEIGNIGMTVRVAVMRIKNSIDELTESFSSFMAGDISGGEVIASLKKFFNGIYTAIFDLLLNPEEIGKLHGSLMDSIGAIFDPTKADSIIPSVYTIFLSIGETLKYALFWLMDTIFSVIGGINLDKIYNVLAGILATIVAAIAGLFDGLSDSSLIAESDEAKAGNGIGLFIANLLSGAAGVILNLATMVIYDIFIGIAGLFVKLFSKPPKESTMTMEGAGDHLYELFAKPFLKTFTGGRAEQIVKFVWFWIRYIQYRIEYTLNPTMIWEGALKIYEDGANYFVQKIVDIMMSVFRAMGVSQETEAILRLRLTDQFVTPVKNALSGIRDNLEPVFEAHKWELAKRYGFDARNGFMPEIPEMPSTAFNINPATGATKNTIPVESSPEEQPGLIERVRAWLAGTRQVVVESLNDPSLSKERAVEVVWTTVPYVKRPTTEQIMRELTNASTSAYQEYLAGGAFNFPIPIILTPETGGDLNTSSGFFGMMKDPVAKLYNAITPIFKDFSDHASADLQNEILTGVSEGVAKSALRLQQIGPQDTTAYKDVGKPQGEAISAGLRDGLTPGIAAVQSLDQSIKKIPEESLPALTLGLDKWRLEMTTRVAPEVSNVKTTVVDPLAKSFDGVTSAVERLNEKILILAERLNNIKIPPQLQANSPTPFEMGLRGIAKTTAALNKQRVPAIFGVEGSGISADQRQKNISAGGDFGRESSINLVVKVGDKEVAGVVATTVAGEIKKMIYRDSLRG